MTTESIPESDDNVWGVFQTTESIPESDDNVWGVKAT